MCTIVYGTAIKTYGAFCAPFKSRAPDSEAGLNGRLASFFLVMLYKLFVNDTIIGNNSFGFCYGISTIVLCIVSLCVLADSFPHAGHHHCDSYSDIFMYCS